MAQVQTFGLGRSVRATVAAESAFNTPTVHTEAGSFKFIKYSITANEERKERRDVRQSRSLINTIMGKRSAEFSIQSYVLPRDGLTGETPDYHQLLFAAMGATSTAGPVTYTLSASQNVPPSFSAIFEHAGIFSEMIAGGVVDNLKLTISGSGEPTWEWTGPCARRIWTGTGTMGAAAAASGTDTATTLTLSTATNANPAYQFELGSYVDIGAGTNTNIEVTAIPSATTITVGSLPEALGGTEAIVPATDYAGTQTGGVPVAGIDGSINLTGIDTNNNIVIVGAEVNVKNNWKMLTEVAFQRDASDAIPGWREVSGNLTFYVRGVDTMKFMRSLQNPNNAENRQACTITLGNSSGPSGTDYCTISLPQIGLDMASAEFPEAEEGTVQVPFRAQTTLSAGAPQEDEITITYTSVA